MDLLLVDLDDTLIQTSEYKNKIFEKLARVCQIPVSQVNEIYQHTKNADLPYKWHILLPKKLSQIHGIDKKKLQNVILDEAPGIKINQQVLDFVKKFKGKKILFSYGDDKFQRLKIKSLDLAKYFDQVLVTQKYKIIQIGTLISGYDHIVVIDNNQEFLREVNSKFPKIKTFLPGHFGS